MPSVPVIIFIDIFGISSLSLSQHEWVSFLDQGQIQKLSVRTMTGPGVRAPSEVYRQSPFWEVWG